jgi:hypothetical protein
MPHAQINAEREQQAIAQRALQSSHLAPQMASPRISSSNGAYANGHNVYPQQQNLPHTQPNYPTISTPPPTHSQPQASTPSSASKRLSSEGARQNPSISALVHATDSISVISDNKSNSSRAGSRSPKNEGKDLNENEGNAVHGEKNGVGAEGERGVDGSRPKDIPHDKLNILGEDQRAIRVLDRKFVF